MKYKEIEIKEVDTDALLGTYASVDDVSEVISEDTILTNDGIPVAIYYRESGIDVEPLRTALLKVDWSHSYRATSKAAMLTYSKVFGYQPRSGMRNRPCSIAALALEYQDLHMQLEEWTAIIAHLYIELAPKAAEVHRKRTADKIKEEYHLAKSMFTSGIINKTNQLPYHFDRGNFEKAWSAMLGIKKWITGGHLVIPEYDVALEISDGSMCLFDGQAHIHGVTPIKKLNPKGERYTIVWYSLEQMWQCLTSKEELEVINKKMTTQAIRKSERGNDTEAWEDYQDR